MKTIACPWLPEVTVSLDFMHTRRHGAVKGAAFYRDALCYAQSQWLAGKPAQAILQLNKAWMADLSGSEQVLAEYPAPYRALVWMLGHQPCGEAGFFGNPVRHFQHLATRVSGPRREVRAWRAWVCFHLAERLLPREPRDGEQMVREGLWIPGMELAISKVAAMGWLDEEKEITGLMT